MTISRVWNINKWESHFNGAFWGGAGQVLKFAGSKFSTLAGWTVVLLFLTQVDTTVVYSGAHEFELRGDYMFVTRPKRDRPGELDLFVSAHGERFVPADFGIDDRDLASLDYHIIDVTDEGQVKWIFLSKYVIDRVSNDIINPRRFWSA